MKKYLSLVLAAMMILALVACGSDSAAETAADEVVAEEPAAEVSAQAEPAAAPASDDLAEWKAYLEAYASAGAPDEAEAQSVIELIEAAATAEDVEAIDQLTVLFENVGVLTYSDWLAAGKPAADTEGMGSEADNQAASGEASGETSGEASGEARTAADVPEGVETKEVEIPFSHPIAGDITVIVTYYEDPVAGITLVSVVDPELGEDILPVQSDENIAALIAAVEAAAA